MSRLRIAHTTTYRYAEPVEFGVHRLVIRPREGHDLQVETLDLSITPAAKVTWHRDIFGNSIALVRFLEAADCLEFRNDVCVVRRDLGAPWELLESLPVLLPVTYDELESPVSRGYLSPVYPEEASALTAWTAETFSPSPGAKASRFVQRINTWIHTNIAYRRREDRGVQTPWETIRSRSGSCRDMATLLLEAVRTAHLASRFASGYLDSAASAAGRAATHAWAEVYFPEHGWIGLDPTLGECTSLKHIVTGVSSHPRGVMPVSGSYSGSPEVFLGMEVAVQISQPARHENLSAGTATGPPAREPSDRKPKPL